MEIGSILLILAVAIAIGMYISQPLFGRSRRMTVGKRELSALLAERDRIINALQELDFDNALGKIPAEDYRIQRTALLQKGADTLKQLDALAPGLPSEAANRTAEDRVESAVSERRADRSGDQPTLNEDDVESLIAARRAARKEKSGGFCPRCGKPILASDRFCPSCGKSIA
jgi:hypothetical protein